MSDTCLFCGLPEMGYEPSKSVEFICGKCVQLLLAADQGDLKKAYQKTSTIVYTRKGSAIETFLVEDEDAETEEHERDLVRERPMQAVRPSRDQVRA